MANEWQRLLDFWFGDLQDGLADKTRRALWFKSDPAFDAACTQFSDYLQCATDGLLADWLTQPRSCLAYIIVCDQLPRNIHRGTKDAFGWDTLALTAARHGIESRFDLQLGWDERSFFYMPFEHAETVVDQHTAVGLMTALRDASPGPIRDITGSYLRFAHQHRDIILRFGRFPHRNGVLGRASSAEEQTFVDAGDGFGQNVG